MFEFYRYGVYAVCLGALITLSVTSGGGQRCRGFAFAIVPYRFCHSFERCNRACGSHRTL